MLVLGDQTAQRLHRQQRRVAVDDDHGLGVAEQPRRRPESVGGSQRALLHDQLDAVLEDGLQPPLRRVDDHDPTGAGGACGGDRPGDDRPPA